MITDFRHTAEKLQRRIDEIAAYVYRERAPISGWRVGPGELPGAHDSSFDDSGWAEFRPLEHIDVPVWLRVRVMVPASFDGQPAALYLRLEGVEHSLFGTETLVYVDGELVHGTDQYHPEIVPERTRRGRPRVLRRAPPVLAARPEVRQDAPAAQAGAAGRVDGHGACANRPGGRALLLGRGHGARRGHDDGRERPAPAADPDGPGPRLRPAGPDGARGRRLLRVVGGGPGGAERRPSPSSRRARQAGADRGGRRADAYRRRLALVRSPSPTRRLPEPSPRCCA